LDRLTMMFGGMNSDEVFNDMWYYNVFTNMWQELKMKVDED